jgi:hypothetical protein
MSTDSTDPRVASWASFFKEFDAWRADPSSPDTPNANDIAIRVAELTRDTIGVLDDDPRIIEARCILKLADEFKTKYGTAGTFAAAGDLIGLMSDWLLGAGYVDAARHRFYASVRDTDYDAPLDSKRTDQMVAAGAAGLLRGEAQYHEDVTTAVLGASIARLYKDDALFQSKGDASLIARKIPGRRQNRLSVLLDMGRGLSILRGHYDAECNASSWLKAHQILIPNVPDETRRCWNKEVDPKLRELARRAGRNAARKSPLDEEEYAMETQIRRHTPEQFREGLAAISKAGSEKAR